MFGAATKFRLLLAVQAYYEVKQKSGLLKIVHKNQSHSALNRTTADGNSILL